MVDSANGLRKIGNGKIFHGFTDPGPISLLSLKFPNPSAQIVVPQVEDGKTEPSHFTGDFRGNPNLSDRQLGLPRLPPTKVLLIDMEAIDLVFPIILFKNGTNPVMGGDVKKIHHGRPDKFFINPSAASMFSDVAPGLFQAVEERTFNLLVENFRSDLNSPSRILNDLNGFDPGKFIKKPTAAGI